MTQEPIFIGIDSGATTSKIGGIRADGSTITLKLRQSRTNAANGTDAVIKGWIEGTAGFLEEHGLSWSQVQGVGLAIPGPYQRYGVLDRSPNLPAEFAGWDVHAACSRGLEIAAGRSIPLVVGNDGNYGGVAEARHLRQHGSASVLMLAPGSGLGCAFVDGAGLPLDGDTLAGMEAAHMPAPLHLLGVPAFPCGCGRTWGCVEVYTTLSGLPHLLGLALKRHPDHPLAQSTEPMSTRVFSLRGLAQKGDALACEIFDFQAKVLGLHSAALVLALDPGFVVIGGGLMDTESTTPEFRERYLRVLREAAMAQMWPQQQKTVQFVPASLGELSQSIGAALVALYRSQLMHP